MIENIEKSEMIKGMSLTKDGNFSRYAKVLTDEEIEKILNLEMTFIQKILIWKEWKAF